MYAVCTNCYAGDEGGFDPLFLAQNGNTVCKICGQIAVTAEESKLALNTVDEFQLPRKETIMNPKSPMCGKPMSDSTRPQDPFFVCLECCCDESGIEVDFCESCAEPFIAGDNKRCLCADVEYEYCENCGHDYPMNEGYCDFCGGEEDEEDDDEEE